MASDNPWLMRDIGETDRAGDAGKRMAAGQQKAQGIVEQMVPVQRTHGPGEKVVVPGQADIDQPLGEFGFEVRRL